MNQKQNINQSVWKILQKDLAVKKGLSRNLINVRALAKNIIKEHGIHASLDSVISAVRRFQEQEVFDKQDKILRNIFQHAVVSTKNNIACISLKIRPREFLKKICMVNTELFPLKITTGSNEFKVMCEQKYLDKIKNMFDKSKIRTIDKNLSELGVRVSEKSIKAKGVMARIGNELALADIVIHEIIICPPEFLIYIAEKDIVKSHEAILKLCEGR